MTDVSAEDRRPAALCLAAVPLLTGVVLQLLEPFPGTFANCGDDQPGRTAAVDAWHAHWKLLGPLSAVAFAVALTAVVGRRRRGLVLSAFALAALLPVISPFLGDEVEDALGPLWIADVAIALPWLVLGAVVGFWWALALGVGLAVPLAGNAHRGSVRVVLLGLAVSAWLAVALAAATVTHGAFAC